MAPIDKREEADKGTQFTCFTGTKVQILGGRQRYSVLSFYWCKSTNTDAEEAEEVRKLLALLVRYSLYWYKSTNTDEKEAEEVRKELGLMHSDHLTTLRAFDGWQASAANSALIEP